MRVSGRCLPSLKVVYRNCIRTAVNLVFDGVQQWTEGKGNGDGESIFFLVHVVFFLHIFTKGKIIYKSILRGETWQRRWKQKQRRRHRRRRLPKRQQSPPPRRSSEGFLPLPPAVRGRGTPLSLPYPRPARLKRAPVYRFLFLSNATLSVLPVVLDAFVAGSSARIRDENRAPTTPGLFAASRRDTRRNRPHPAFPCNGPGAYGRT